MELLTYADREMLFLSLANRLTGELGQALRSGGRASIAVPGGTTPGPLFDLMSDVDLDWSAVTVLPSDERWVPADHPRSNELLLRQRLLRGPAAAAQLVSLAADDGTPEAGIAARSAQIAPALPLTCALIGMGDDMHVASLFPDGDQLAEALAPDAPPLLAMRAPGAPEPRLTLSARCLTDAIHLHILILGPSKREALQRAQGLTPMLAPVRAVLDNAIVHWAE